MKIEGRRVGKVKIEFIDDEDKKIFSFEIVPVLYEISHKFGGFKPTLDFRVEGLSLDYGKNKTD